MSFADECALDIRVGKQNARHGVHYERRHHGVDPPSSSDRGETVFGGDHKRADTSNCAIDIIDTFSTPAGWSTLLWARIGEQSAMPQSTYSFIYDRASADTAVHGIAPRELTLSILAGIPPGPDSEGCLVYLGASPFGAATVCVGTRGPSADEVQLRLLEGFERLAVTILEVYEGGPEVVEAIATASGGQWAPP